MSHGPSEFSNARRIITEQKVCSKDVDNDTLGFSQRRCTAEIILGCVKVHGC